MAVTGFEMGMGHNLLDGRRDEVVGREEGMLMVSPRGYRDAGCRMRPPCCSVLLHGMGKAA